MTRNIDIYLVGCGGIGANFLSSFSQFIHGTVDLQNRLRTFYLYDGDVIEGKNLQRTPFAPYQVGKAKTQALYQNYNNTNLLPLTPCNVFINAENINLVFERSNDEDVDLLVLVVTDHVWERAYILNYLMNSMVNKNIMWATAGNSLDKGTALSWIKKDGVNNPFEYSTPFDFSEKYRDMLNYPGRDHLGGLGCGMTWGTEQEAGQSLMINLMSQLALLYIVKEYFTSRRWIPFVEYQDIDGQIQLINKPGWEPVNLDEDASCLCTIKEEPPYASLELLREVGVAFDDLTDEDDDDPDYRDYPDEDLDYPEAYDMTDLDYMN